MCLHIILNIRCTYCFTWKDHDMNTEKVSRLYTVSCHQPYSIQVYVFCNAVTILMDSIDVCITYEYKYEISMKKSLMWCAQSVRRYIDKNGTYEFVEDCVWENHKRVCVSFFVCVFFMYCNIPILVIFFSRWLRVQNVSICWFSLSKREKVGKFFTDHGWKMENMFNLWFSSILLFFTCCDTHMKWVQQIRVFTFLKSTCLTLVFRGKNKKCNIYPRNVVWHFIFWRCGRYIYAQSVKTLPFQSNSFW